MKKSTLINTIIIFAVLAAISGFGGFLFWLFGGQPETNQLAQMGISSLSDSEISFLVDNDFLEYAPDGSESAQLEEEIYLKPPDLVEQNLNSDKENFEVLATKLDKSNYQMAFKLENKTEQDKEFYLIPVSKESQLQFAEIKGVIENGVRSGFSNSKKTRPDTIFGKEDASQEPLEKLYDTEKHKKELSPELAKAYQDIKDNGYSAKPIKIILPPKSTLLANSNWQVSGSLTPAGSATGLKPVYFLVYGSAGGAKDDLVVLNIHSSPQQGENWVVYFTTRGTGDLKIIPDDKATIADDEFVLLGCNLDHNNKKRTPQILKGDIIYFPNWDCAGVSRVVHLTKKAGKHTLKLEFNNTTTFAYNDSQLAKKKEPGKFSFNQYNGLPETTSERTYNTKVFDNYLNEVGTKRYSIHTAQINYKNGNNFEEIDTRLFFQDGKWKTDKASYHPTIPEYADQWFEFYNAYEGVNQTIKAKPVASHVKGEYFEDEKEGVYVLYRNAFGQGIDLKVFAEPAGLKKVIVLNKKPADISQNLNFDFELELPAGAKVIKEDNSEWDLSSSLDFSGKKLRIGSNGKFSYFNPALVWDSNTDIAKKINEKVEIKLFKQGNKIYLRKTITKDILAKAVYPLMTDHPTNYYAGAGDGYAGSGSQTSWDTAHNATDSTNTSYTWTSNNPCSTTLFVDSVWYWNIIRAFFPINTSALDDSATITSAVLSVYVTTKTLADDDSEAWINIVQTSQASNTELVDADYDQCGAVHSPTWGATAVNISAISTSARNTWTLNATGLAWINKTGFTLLGMREGHDGTDSAVQNGTNSISFRTADYSGTTYDPYLDVTAVPITSILKVKGGLRVKSGLHIKAP